MQAWQLQLLLLLMKIKKLQRRIVIVMGSALIVPAHVLILALEHAMAAADHVMDALEHAMAAADHVMVAQVVACIAARIHAMLFAQIIVKILAQDIVKKHVQLDALLAMVALIVVVAMVPAQSDVTLLVMQVPMHKL